MRHAGICCHTYIHASRVADNNQNRVLMSPEAYPLCEWPLIVLLKEAPPADELCANGHRLDSSLQLVTSNSLLRFADVRSVRSVQCLSPVLFSEALSEALQAASLDHPSVAWMSATCSARRCRMLDGIACSGCPFLSVKGLQSISSCHRSPGMLEFGIAAC